VTTNYSSEIVTTPSRPFVGSRN